MVRSALSKVAWVGRTASMVFGLALVMALLFGVASTALGANGGNFILGKATNAATKVTGLIGRWPPARRWWSRTRLGDRRWVLAWATRLPTRLRKPWRL